MKRFLLAIAVAILAASGTQASTSTGATGPIQTGTMGTGTQYTCVKTLVFSEGDKEIGRLTWEGGEARFIGKADKSAKRFFNDLVKKYLQPALDAQAKEGK